MDDVTLHGGLIGQQGSRAALNTPVLVLDIAALDRNIAKMQALVEHHAVALRPHAKTHKSVDIAQRQIAAGAVGVCCAKIGEAEVLVDGDVRDVLITSPVAAHAAITRLAQLAALDMGVMSVVDAPAIASALNEALRTIGARMAVLIDIDPGIHRTGVASPDAAVALAAHIATLDHIDFAGVQFYCGMQQHIEDFAERRTSIVERTDYLRTVIDALTQAGFTPGIVSGGGTGTHAIDLELGLFTELQTGSYVFMDRQYLDCALAESDPAPFEVSLMVDSRVVSANHAKLVTIDAGFKSLSSDGGVATVVRGGPPESGFAFMGDEHSALIYPAISDMLNAGDAVSLIVPHCDPTVNLYDYYHVVDGDTLVAMWPVSARGRAR